MTNAVKTPWKDHMDGVPMHLEYPQCSMYEAVESIAGQYPEDSRIPSVREYAVLLQVNTNTAMKAYDQLARDEVIYNKRGSIDKALHDSLYKQAAGS